MVEAHVKEGPADQDVIDIVTPKLELWKEYATQSTAPKINRRIFERMSIPGLERNVPKSGLPTFIEDGNTEIDLIGQIVGGEPRNAIVFAPGNVMLWHTNSYAPGHRVYFIYNEMKGSVFRYKDEATGEIIDCVEPEGWIRRDFLIPEPEDGLLWHCVYAEGVRVTLGFRLFDEHMRN